MEFPVEFAPSDRRHADHKPFRRLSVVAFRYGEDDAFNERLIKRLQDEGRVMLSGTRIDGRFLIRCAILSFRTHVEHVDQAIVEACRGAKGSAAPA